MNIASVDDDTWKNWKRVAPCLYDFLANHHLVWPALACRFGTRQEAEGGRYRQTVYVSEQTAPESKTANKLVAHSVHVPEMGFAPIDHVTSWKENQKSPYVGKPDKTINHPGECNKIRDFPGHDGIIATHSDCPEVYIWDMNTQPDSSAHKKADKMKTNAPDLKLTGHTKDAQFALATSSFTPSIVSGGEDTDVLIWNLNDGDHMSLLESGNLDGRGGTLAARTKLRGHSNTVTDVCFQPGSDRYVASTADDHVIRTWDTRQDQATNALVNAHGASSDILSVDWCAHDQLLATGGHAGDLRIWDLRALTAADGTPKPLHVLMTQPSARGANQSGILVVEWSPTQRGWVASGGDDGRVTIWDVTRATSANESDGLPSQLVLQHLGHLGSIMDLQWSPQDPYTLASVSNDGGTFKEGGALQMWRMSTLITDDIETVKTELELYTDWLVSGKMTDLQRAKAPVNTNKPKADAQPAAAEPPALAEAAADHSAAEASMDAAPSAPAGSVADGAADAKVAEEAAAEDAEPMETAAELKTAAAPADVAGADAAGAEEEPAGEAAEAEEMAAPATDGDAAASAVEAPAETVAADAVPSEPTAADAEGSAPDPTATDASPPGAEANDAAKMDE